jgi:hypothetical protein
MARELEKAQCQPNGQLKFEVGKEKKTFLQILYTRHASCLEFGTSLQNFLPGFLEYCTSS